jgi:hypothetical protein
MTLLLTVWEARKREHDEWFLRASATLITWIKKKGKRRKEKKENGGEVPVYIYNSDFSHGCVRAMLRT